MRELMIAAVCLCSQMLMSQEKSQACFTGTDTVTAARILHEISVDAPHPATEWRTAGANSFCEDWQGRNEGAGRQLQVGFAWKVRGTLGSIRPGALRIRRSLIFMCPRRLAGCVSRADEDPARLTAKFEENGRGGCEEQLHVTANPSAVM